MDLEKYSVILLVSLVSRGNGPFSTVSKEDQSFFQPKKGCSLARITLKHMAASLKGFQLLVQGRIRKILTPVS